MFDRLSDRLDNLGAVTPMLSALRLVALGSWQASKKQLRGVSHYQAELQRIMPFVQDLLPDPGPAADLPLLLVGIGTERGLVGRFMEQLAEFMEAKISELDQPLQLHLMGSRLRRIVQRDGREPHRFEPLPTSGLPDWQKAVDLASGWWQAVQGGKLAGVTIIYQTTTGLQPAVPRATPLLPLARRTEGEISKADPKLPWPPPILDTDPVEMAAELSRLWLYAATYEVLLTAAEAEHVTRYQLLEAAVQNAERLTEELTTELRSAQQQAVTREMQELVVGAGMLD